MDNRAPSTPTTVESRTEILPYDATRPERYIVGGYVHQHQWTLGYQEYLKSRAGGAGALRIQLPFDPWRPEEFTETIKVKEKPDEVYQYKLTASVPGQFQGYAKSRWLDQYGKPMDPADTEESTIILTETE